MSRPIDPFKEEIISEPIIEVPAAAVEASEMTVEAPEVAVEASAPVEAPAPVVEAPAPVVEAPAPVVEAPAQSTDTADKVIYSIREKNLPEFGWIKKGYTKINYLKAEELTKKYSFIRYASESEIKDYVPHLL